MEFYTTFEEVCELHEKAGIFCDQVMEFLNLKMSFPEPPWGLNEMEQLIPQLMKIYMLAMGLPDLEYMEDMKYEEDDSIPHRPISFVDEYEYYWTVFDPYCKYAETDEEPKKEIEPCKGMLTDDLADISTELSQGVEAYRAGLVCEAIFQWRFGLLSHYGNHITSALRAMTSAWEYETQHRDREMRDYWNPDEDSIIVGDKQ
ncbi:MAG: DUF5063 domain-containing protein [Lachnospiraceae bacterium]|nr:DUF5063 domain-containing protein [Lachnospiraceae bacterium]